MANLNTLMEKVRVRLPGALDDAIKQEALAALDEFLRGASAWQEDVEITTVPGERVYAIPSPNDAAVAVRLLYVQNEDEFPVRAVMPNIGLLQLLAEPADVQTYHAMVAFSITDLEDDSEPSYPDWLLTAYLEDLFDGVLGRMMSQPAKPYSNERLAIYHLRRFRNSIAKARVATQHQNISGGQRWRFPRVFTGR